MMSTINQRQMPRLVYIIISVVNIVLFTACNDNSDTVIPVDKTGKLVGNWVKCYNFEGTSHSDDVVFSYNNRGFILTDRTGSYYFDDMYELKA
ncbi:hypothetical protein [Dysgonomonas capnocytophagoides]|uniref:hypothetical protein n=2 Tax=Dysgonomonas capnocytophagoides TaxID=45254 RepID=UPI0030C87D46